MRFTYLMTGMLAVAASAYAGSYTITFQENNNQLTQGQQVAEFYNGGQAFDPSAGAGGSFVGASGPNYGVEFLNAEAVVATSAVGQTPGNGNTYGSPSPWTTIDYAGGNGILINAYGGFTGLSFWYSTGGSGAGSYTVYDATGGVDGGANPLGSGALPNTADGAGLDGCGGQPYCPWTLFTIPTSILANSDMNDANNNPAGFSIFLQGSSFQHITFDDFTFYTNGDTAPTCGAAGLPACQSNGGPDTPEPSTMALFVGGAALIGVSRKYFRKKA